LEFLKILVVHFRLMYGNKKCLKGRIEYLRNIRMEKEVEG
jgi:hypothetical protein